MKFEIVELEEFSGTKATVYSVWVNDSETTLFDQFVEENQAQYSQELQSIIDRLDIISRTTGAREQFFKLNEGTSGDGICALYDSPNKKLRLYLYPLRHYMHFVRWRWIKECPSITGR